MFYPAAKPPSAVFRFNYLGLRNLLMDALESPKKCRNPNCLFCCGQKVVIGAHRSRFVRFVIDPDEHHLRTGLMNIFRTSIFRYDFCNLTELPPENIKTFFVTERPPSAGLCDCLIANDAFVVTRIPNISFDCSRCLNLNGRLSHQEFIYKILNATCNPETLIKHCRNCKKSDISGLEGIIVSMLSHNISPYYISMCFQRTVKTVSRRKLIYMARHGLKTNQDLYVFCGMRAHF